MGCQTWRLLWTRWMGWWAERTLFISYDQWLPLLILLWGWIKAEEPRKNRTKKQAFEQRLLFLVVMVEEYNVHIDTNDKKLCCHMIAIIHKLNTSTPQWIMKIPPMSAFADGNIWTANQSEESQKVVHFAVENAQEDQPYIAFRLWGLILLFLGDGQTTKYIWTEKIQMWNTKIPMIGLKRKARIWKDVHSILLSLCRAPRSHVETGCGDSVGPHTFADPCIPAEDFDKAVGLWAWATF